VADWPHCSPLAPRDAPSNSTRHHERKHVVAHIGERDPIRIAAPIAQRLHWRVKLGERIAPMISTAR
jgi:hypothetical protein